MAVADDRQKKLDAVVAAGFDPDSLGDDKGRYQTDIEVAAAEAVMWLHTLRLNGTDLTERAHLKLVHEAQEFADMPSLDEAADVFIALTASVYYRGWTVASLANAVHEKVLVNRQRTWQRSDDGTFQHVPAPVPSRREVEGGAL